MPDQVLRRQAIPRVCSRAVRTSKLPSFLNKGSAVPMVATPVNGPMDALEQAILASEVWDQGSEPVQIDAFDADQDVISVIVEEGDAQLHFDIREGRDGMQILANGQTLAQVAAAGRTFSKSDIRVIQARTRF